MIKFLARPKPGEADHQLLGLGLSRENMDRLLAGQPILINGPEVGLELDVLLFFGETEQVMADELARHGFITSDTDILDER